ncbi:MAG: DUF86 domain-containing protein [Bacteroidales bacterium]|jgi:uncharacterized protein with HEPN domain|nr:DUF86 domain-containing protein [Bacteroidales bacterium]
MFNKELIADVLKQIYESLQTITERTKAINNADDFYSSPYGMTVLDSICMKLIAVGESIKNLDKHTNKQFLQQYPTIEWKGVMGLRDIIVHHYFDVDAEEIIRIVKEDIPLLERIIQKMLDDIL